LATSAADESKYPTDIYIVGVMQFEDIIAYVLVLSCSTVIYHGGSQI
jgi:hypothetical protein